MNMIVGPFVVTKGYTPFCDSNHTQSFVTLRLLFQEKISNNEF